MIAASELLLRRVSAARNSVALNFREDAMKDYSRVEIEGSGGLSAGDFPLATVAVVGSIVALTGFLFVFLLVSI
jgi:hypothetical protein